MRAAENRKALIPCEQKDQQKDLASAGVRQRVLGEKKVFSTLIGCYTSLRYTCIKRDFCVIFSQTESCAVANLLKQVKVWYMKHVHHVQESCMRHCIEDVFEVEVHWIVSLFFPVGFMCDKCIF